jgi:hypothetical protein
MRFYDVTFTVKLLLDFLGVKYQTINAWLKNGLFNPEKFKDPGRGNKRTFSFEDVFMAKVAHEVLMCTKSYEIAKAVLNEFHDFISYLPDTLLPDFMYSPITDDGGTEFFYLEDLLLYLIVNKDDTGRMSKPTFYWTYRKEDFGTIPEEVVETDKLVILVPIGNMFKEVDTFFREIERRENNLAKEGDEN